MPVSILGLVAGEAVLQVVLHAGELLNAGTLDTRYYNRLVGRTPAGVVDSRSGCLDAAAGKHDVRQFRMILHTGSVWKPT